jgi:hypothetical protein
MSVDVLITTDIKTMTGRVLQIPGRMMLKVVVGPEYRFESR